MAEALTTPTFLDTRLMELAREIAMDIHPLEDILKRLNISLDQWEDIQKNRTFIELLRDQILTWQGALNGSERIKIKSLTAIEEWLGEAYSALYNEKHPLRDRTELAKVIARFAGIGERQANELAAGEKISITINMGTEAVHAEKTVIPKIIEHEDHL